LTYHDGELAVQRSAGAQGMAARVGRSISSRLNALLEGFLAEQDTLVIASLDHLGRPWVSVITGAPGLLYALDSQTLEVRSPIAQLDPLAENIHVGASLGLLAIDLLTRSRVRVNGRVIQASQEGFELHVLEAYGNCQKYIQRRDSQVRLGPDNPSPARVGSSLNLAQRAMLERADTLFIATAHPATGADASHRGGTPGFVRVLDDGRLELPDYAGNKMFNTLGNIEATGRAGLLIVDFDHDLALHLTGSARIVWDTGRVAAHRGAERLVEFAPEWILERPALTRRRWQLLEASPFNPS
jgi:uncharacterized protein